MVENLKRFREPLTIIVMLAMVANMVISVVRLSVEVTAEDAPVPAAFQDIANSSMNLTLVVLLTGLVLTCLFIVPRSRHAVTLTFWAASIVTIGTLLTLIAAAIGLSASSGVLGVVLEFLGGLLDILIKAIAAGSLWLIWKSAKTGRFSHHAPKPQVVAEPMALPDPADSQPSPMWEPNEAAGTVWRSAADAASGSPAAGQGMPGGSPGAWWEATPEVEKHSD